MSGCVAFCASHRLEAIQNRLNTEFLYVTMNFASKSDFSVSSTEKSYNSGFMLNSFIYGILKKIDRLKNIYCLTIKMYLNSSDEEIIHKRTFRTFNIK